MLNAQVGSMRKHLIHLIMVMTGSGLFTQAQAGPFDGLEARIDTPCPTVLPGQPVIIEFTLRNNTENPIALSVADLTAEPSTKVVGLPLSHVFSGTGYTGLTVRGQYNRTWTDVFDYQQPASAPELIIAPHAIVGIELDMSQYYPPLKSAGEYRIVWQPYGGMVTSNQLVINVAPHKQALIVTDEGTMTVKMRYDLAPEHVANFLELARSGFYNHKTFHRIVPGYFLQGGCPNGDGSGIRLDGKRLKAEFSDDPVDRGTVCMARLESDPDSASCQFLISYTRIASWDGKYTVFGDLVGDDSFKTLDNLMAIPVDDATTGHPRRSVFIRDVRIVDAPVSQDAIDPSKQSKSE